MSKRGLMAMHGAIKDNILIRGSKQRKIRTYKWTSTKYKRAKNEISLQWNTRDS